MSVDTAEANFQQLAKLSRALADETRLRIVDALRSGEQCVCELMDELDIPQSLLSFHLKTLKAAGVLVDRRAGRWAYYSLVPDGCRDLWQFLEPALSAGQTPSHAGSHD